MQIIRNHVSCRPGPFRMTRPSYIGKLHIISKASTSRSKTGMDENGIILLSALYLERSYLFFYQTKDGYCLAVF